MSSGSAGGPFDHPEDEAPLLRESDAPPIEMRIARVRDRIAAAAARAGRDPAAVRLVAISKTVGPDRIRRAMAAGLREFGENRVQEAREKIPLLPVDLVWHMVGGLQRNKAKLAARLFSVIQSVDRMSLAEVLAAAAGPDPVPVLVQVNLGDEPQKGGVTPDHLPDLVRALARLDGIRVRGLMTIPPVGRGREASRPHFRTLHRLAADLDRLALPGVTMQELSMGMSADFETAVEEGATQVRLGTALFGPRPAPPPADSARNV